MGRNNNRRVRRRRRRTEKRKDNNTMTEAEPSIFPIIPEEIVLEILSRLPLTSLSRFACVSKQWHSSISRVSAAKPGRQMVLVMAVDTVQSIDEEDRVVVQIQKPWKASYCRNVILILGSCNGLLLVNINEDLFLWNPLTRYFKIVISYDRLADDDYRIVSGLFYDSKTDEYKAVMSFSHQSPEYGRQLVEVWGLRRKTWIEICFPYNVRSINAGPVVNGYLHWFVSRKNSHHFLEPHVIVYFHPRRGKFKEVPMPVPKQEGGDTILHLGVLEGCLCMSRWEDPCDGYRNLEVLAMKQYGVEKSWTTMFMIWNLSINSYPLGFTKNGQALLGTYDRKGVWLMRVYKPDDNANGNISISIPARIHNVHTVMYEESLINPTGYEWKEEDMRGQETYVECNAEEFESDSEPEQQEEEE